MSASGVSQLTRDTVDGVSRAFLRTRTAESGPYLFWATQPSWSPDGSLVAYVTNRSWMLVPGSGQELWLVDVAAGRERPLLSTRGEFYSPQGWLGSELLYTSRAGGIDAINVRDGQRRTIARDGTAVTSMPNGGRLLYMTGKLDSLRAYVLSLSETIAIPNPPPGQRFDYAGAFSPSGRQLLLGTSFAADSGMTRALYVFDIASRRLTPFLQWNFRESGRHPGGIPAWLDESTLLVSRSARGRDVESSVVFMPR